MSGVRPAVKYPLNIFGSTKSALEKRRLWLANVSAAVIAGVRQSSARAYDSRGSGSKYGLIKPDPEPSAGISNTGEHYQMY
jgi:hypothetical protein